MNSRLGLLVAGSVAEGLSARLDPTVPIEDVRLGKFVKIVGQKYEYFCLVTDVQLDSANPDVLAEALKLGDHVMIMRAGKIVQIGRPEELVARPADEYVEDFVRDIPKSHVLTLRWVMRPANANDPVDGPVFPVDTIIRMVIHAAAATDKPIRVIEDGQLVGVVDRAHILETVAGQGNDAEVGPPT